MGEPEVQPLSVGSQPKPLSTKNLPSSSQSEKSLKGSVKILVFNISNGSARMCFMKSRTQRFCSKLREM